MKPAFRNRRLLFAWVLGAPFLVCAYAGCSGDKVAIGADRLGAADGGRDVPCGPKTCAAGQVCCNANCGICAEPGNDCALMECEANCNDEQQAVLAFIAANKACTSTADCQTQYVGCGVTEDDCTGAVYVNQSIDSATWSSLVGNLTSCMGSDAMCATCDRVSSAVACVSGRCRRADFGCSDAEQAMRDFIAANKACNTMHDCQTQHVGCGITEGDCTGAVYVNDDTDLATFESLRSAYIMCTVGDAFGCGLCTMLPPPPACVAGRCQ